jgi:hypothetical protein
LTPFGRVAWTTATAALIAATVFSGCGTVDRRSRDIASGRYDVSWHDSLGARRARVVFTVERIVLRPPRWSVTASVANRTATTLQIDRPHRPGSTLFGLLPFRTASSGELERAIRAARFRAPLVASSFDPPLPRDLRPRRSWRGVFSGLGTLEAGGYVRVEFGRFIPRGPIPRGLSAGMIELTDRALHLRAPSASGR